MPTIAETVAANLAGQPESYLQDVVDHGIHNLTNDFEGDDEAEYHAYRREFEAQARALLWDMEVARMKDDQ
jgi:hypothetical protein